MALSVDPSVYEHISALEAAADKYIDAVGEVFNEVEKLSTSSAWIGSDNNDFITAITPYKPKLQQLGEVIKDIASNLRGGVNAAYETQQNVSNATTNL
jgi:uncharacterized protein YukE